MLEQLSPQPSRITKDRANHPALRPTAPLKGERGHFPLTLERASGTWMVKENGSCVKRSGLNFLKKLNSYHVTQQIHP